MKRRSQLYVPANNPRMLEKAATLEADSVILDLEDAIPPEQKVPTRGTLAADIRRIAWGRREVCVRVNGLGSPEGPEDVKVVSREGRVDALVIPKAEGDLSPVSRDTGKNLVPLIETALGLTRIEDVVRSEGVVAVSYGAGDLAVSVGGDIRAYARNVYVKTRIVTVASAYGVDAIDRVYFDLEDVDGFRSEALESRGLGYVGKQVVHPRQVTLANAIYAPDPKEVAWARQVVDAYESAARNGRGAIRVRDQVVDAVHYRWAQKVLERAGT
ncbi:MAG TPA: CoA ester lyase [Thermoplasmata archaeon]|nr:CoA ester lyase [Thermoplasmata archaeon]